MRYAFHFIGFGIAVFNIPAPYASEIARVALAVGIFLSLTNYKVLIRGYPKARIIFYSLLAYITPTAIGLVFGVYEQSSLVITDLTRQVFLLFFIFAMYVQIKSNKDINLGIYTWTVIALIIHGFIYIYAGVLDQLLNLQFDFYSAKNYKSYVRLELGVPLNSMLPETLIFLCLMYVSVKNSKQRKIVGWILVFVSLLLPLITGVRSALAVSVFTFFVYILSKSPSLFSNTLRMVYASFLLALFIGGYVVLLLNPYILSWGGVAELTTGRTELWFVAIEKHRDAIFFGVGPLHSLLDLFNYLELFGSEHLERFEMITGGAMHSIWFTVLAERGIIAYIFAFIIWFMLVMNVLTSLGSLKEVKYLDQGSQVNKIRVLGSAILGLFILSMTESFGMFGYANSSIDFTVLLLVFMFIQRWGFIREGLKKRGRFR